MEKKIAYLIAAHNDVQHLKRLIQALDDRADFFIHIDKKSNIDINDVFFQKPNMFMLSDDERIKVYWAGFSQVEATLRLIGKYLEVSAASSSPYLKVVFFSGACYPIKSSSYIYDYLNQHHDINFIRGMDVTSPNHYKYNYSLKSYHFFDMQLVNKATTRIVRKMLYYLAYPMRKRNYYVDGQGYKRHIFHGSSWWALNHDAVQYIDEYSKKERGLSQYFKYTMASDEKFFHTIFFNSHFAKKNLAGGPEPFTPSTAAFANLHIIDRSLTKWFTQADFPEVEKSDRLFVRKVSTERSHELLDLIDEKCLT